MQDHDQLPEQFRKAYQYPPMQLHEFAGGLRLRAWKEYGAPGDPAFVGLWAQTLQSSRISDPATELVLVGFPEVSTTCTSQGVIDLHAPAILCS